MKGLEEVMGAGKEPARYRRQPPISEELYHSSRLHHRVLMCLGAGALRAYVSKTPKSIEAVYILHVGCDETAFVSASFKQISR